MNGKLYPADLQGKGVLDGGRIIESKPIGLSGEGSAVTRVGPLFYWSWFQSPLDGYTGLHAHQGFEMITYMIQGKAVHQNSLGTTSEVEAGGLQLMRTGSGVKREERFVGPNAEGLQIWFEPHLRNALKLNPSYRQYRYHDFHVEHGEGVIRKTVIGNRSPVDLTVDVNMVDVRMEPGKEMNFSLGKGRSMAALALRGGGSWSAQENSTGIERLPFQHKDFIVWKGNDEGALTLSLKAEESLRMICIDVPEDPGYPLYAKKP
ncbi:pirin family protein [Paenibacillus lemnae]|uniref:Pirin n=1 Tax=Paenibacillus lemnae TaxID=1330551 RepID=A0A848M9T8_PAELE|nr:pirin family protein [Paenibacillus lemnae]NMO97366.1 pirin [Paenibacillus lemnae]